jgi:putative ABC transport system permease protein
MNHWIRFSFKEIINSKQFSLFFIVNLAIGLIGYVSLTSFHSSVLSHFNQNLKDILTADIMVSASKPVDNKHLQIIEKEIGTNQVGRAETITFFSMIATINQSKLVEVNAIDTNFPLYGKLHLRNSENSNNQILQEDNYVWMTEDSAISLGLQPGHILKIGSAEFILNDFITKDRMSSLTGIGFAPRVFIGLDRLEKTGLVQFGSRIRYQYYYQIPSNINGDNLVDQIMTTLKSINSEQLPFSIIGPSQVNRRLGRITTNFTSFMGLIGIVALFLAGIGTSYLFRNYFKNRINQIAILLSLGVSRIQAYFIYLFQISILGAIASLLTIIISSFLIELFPIFFESIVPDGLIVSVSFEAAIRALIIGTGSSIIFCLPVIVSIHDLKPLHLLQRNLGVFQGKQTKRRIRLAISFLPLFVIIWLLAVEQLNSFENGSWFFLEFCATLIILSIIGLLVLYSCKYLSRVKNPFLRIAFRNLYRNRVTALSCFLAMSMGTFLISTIPQIQKGLETEINKPQNMTLPGYFLVDIQPEQLEPLKQFLNEKNAPLNHISPIIRGRIEKVNGKEFIRNSNSNRNFRRREYNFSYRTGLGDSESIIEGRPLSQNKNIDIFTDTVEISIAENFADRRDFKLDDVIQFDVQGIPVSGKIINIRKVRWNSFQPNFYILFQDGVLNDAPKTYLASIPNVPDASRQKFQFELVKKFPNISILNIKEIVDQVLFISQRVSFAINFMAYLSILTGFIVVYSVVRNEAGSRKWEINLVKVLGGKHSEVRSIFIIEFGFLSIFATLTAILLSLIFSYILSVSIFGHLWELHLQSIVLIGCLIVATTIVTALIGTNHVIKQKPLGILNAKI